MTQFQKNVADQVLGFTALSSVDGTGVEVDLADLKLIGDNVDLGAAAGTLEYMNDGDHIYIPTQAETNVEHLFLAWNAAGTIPNGSNFYASPIYINSVNQRVGFTALDINGIGKTSGITGKIYKDGVFFAAATILNFYNKNDGHWIYQFLSSEINSDHTYFSWGGTNVIRDGYNIFTTDPLVAAAANQINCSLFTYDEYGALESGVVVHFQIISPPSYSKRVGDSTIATYTSVAGIIENILLWKTATYEYWRDGTTKKKRVTIRRSDDFELPSIVGMD